MLRRHSLSVLVAVAVAAAACTNDSPSPDLTINRSRASAQLRHFESCDDLVVNLRDNVRERTRTMLLQQREMLRDNGGYFRGGDLLAGAPEAAVDDSNGAGRQEGVDFSGTNNQEQGVDEADIVKTDGYFIYALNGDRLEILGVPEFGQLTAVSSLRLEGYPQQMLLDGDRAVVFSSIYAYDGGNASRDVAALLQNDDGSSHGDVLTKVTVVALGADRTSPRVERELFLQGYLLTGRRVEHNVRVANYAFFDVPGLRTWLDVSSNVWDSVLPESVRFAEIDRAFDEAIRQNDVVLARTQLSHFVPRLLERQGTGLVDLPLQADACTNVAIPEDGSSFGFTSLLTLGLEGDTIAVEADHVVTNYPVLYSSTDTLILAEQAQDWWWYWGNEDFVEATNLHRFDLKGSTTTYTGSGRVDGTVLNQFALSEHDGIVRVASTEGQWGRWWLANPEPAVTQVVTLGGANSLEVLGTVGGIAPNERLWSVRFTPSEAYLVTFQNIDPLWTIDLSDVANPRVLGELEVPGVSTYIHPLGDTLLTIGLGGGDGGLGLDWGSTQLSLFDISDRTAPTLSSTLALSAGDARDGWQYSYSEATYEHKAFTYWGPLAQVAVPLSTWRWDNSGFYEYKSELVLAHAEEGQPLSIDARIDHSEFFNGSRGEWYDYRDIRRSIFMGDYLYAISDKGVTATRLTDLEVTARVALRGFPR